MHYSKLLFSFLIGVFLLLVITPDVTAQSRRSKKIISTQYSPQLHESVQYRSIGPFRGGRSAAVVGVPNQPKVFYFSVFYKFYKIEIFLLVIFLYYGSL